MVSRSPGTREDGRFEFTDVSVVEPQSVPTRISVVLVEEAKIGGAHRVECYVWITIYGCWREWRNHPV